MIKLNAVLRRDASKSNSDWKVDTTGLTDIEILAYFAKRKVSLTDANYNTIMDGKAAQLQIGNVYYRTILDKYIS